MSDSGHLAAVEESLRLLGTEDSGSTPVSRLIGRTPSGAPILMVVDTDGGRHLLVPVPHDGYFEPDHRSRGVRLARKRWELDDGVHSYADLACDRPHLFPHFSVVCAEVLDALTSLPGRPDQSIRGVLARWRELLASAPREGPSRAEIVGVFCELVVLQELQRIRADAVAGWKGPEGALHDFVFGPLAIEVKGSEGNSEPLIDINGENQLVRENGDLFLAWARLERNPSGETVFDRADSVIEAGASRELVHRALGRLGISRETRYDVDSHRFRVTERRSYRVDSDFPRITPRSFKGDRLPPGVSKVRYVLSLAGVATLPNSEWEAAVGDARD